MYPVHPKLAAIHQSVLASKRLEKLAHDYADDREVLTKLAEVKVQVDAEIFELAKEAGAWGTAFKSGPLRSLATAGAVGTGLGIPAYLVGKGIIDRGQEATENAASSIRNKVLQTALGLGGIGAGVYGLHKLMGGNANTPKAGGGDTAQQDGGGLLSLLPKFGSDEKGRVEEILEKLATVGTIEGMLDTLPETVDSDTQKLATEIRTLNRSYGVHLLHELYPDDI